MNDLDSLKKIHFIGIGGIGVSAIARMFLLEGKEVSGSDRDSSMVTEELEKLGAKIFIGQKAENVPADADLVVYTIAIPTDNPERQKVKELGIKELSYPEMLGVISANKFTVAVSGTHGKTTTTAMIAKVMIDAGLDPTVIVGSFLKDFKSNFIAGRSKYFVIEACEYKKSFLNLSPDILVITNIDSDHLDFYKDLDDIKNAFAELKGRVKTGGKIFTEAEYSKAPDDFNLQAPGRHNIQNAQATFIVARELGVAEEKIKKSLTEFSGTWRRFDFLGQTKDGVLVYDDYAHHPHEVQASLAGFREKFSDKKIIVVFQPHLYSRTKLLIDEFAESFNDADTVIITPIYAAREPKDPEISHHILAREIAKNHKNVTAVDNLEEVEIKLKGDQSADKVIITMGAGDIVNLGQRLL